MQTNVHIIMPVKDAPQMTEQAIRAVVASGYTLTVYDDRSTAENAARLDALGQELGLRIVHIGEHTDHPSPNYRWVLIDAQRTCRQSGSHLVIIESDVCIRPDTIERMTAAVAPKTALVAAVTTDEQGQINFPYEYARQLHTDGPCRKRLSFCCTLLTNEWLHTYDFEQLDPRKNWYDVTISHLTQQLGFDNILQVSNPVVHTPHSSRPWKQLKYTHPLRYYWQKIFYGRDKI